VGGNLNVAGSTISTNTDDSTTSLSGAITTLGGLGVKLKANVGGNLDVAGMSTLAQVDINSGNIDNTVIGATTAVAASVSTLIGTDTTDSSSSILGAFKTAGGLGVKKNVNIGVNLDVAGLSTLAQVDVNSGNIDNTVIGATTAVAGSFTAVVATTISSTDATDSTSSQIGAVILAGGMGIKKSLNVGATLDVAGIVTNTDTTDSSSSSLGAVVTAGGLGVKLKANIGANLDVAGMSTLAQVDINSGNIDNTVIGASTEVAATVSTLTATDATDTTSPTTGAVKFTGGLGVAKSVQVGLTMDVVGLSTLATVDINGGAIDGTVIGPTTPAAATATTLTSTTGLTVVSGGATVTNGGLKVNAGGATVTAGGLSVVDAGTTLTTTG
jgi:hypothetical protein